MPNPIPIRSGEDAPDPMFQTVLRAEVCAECWTLFETRVAKWSEKLLCPDCSLSFAIEMEEFDRECREGDAS